MGMGSTVNIAIIGSNDNADREEYLRYKQQLKDEALHNPEKQTRKKAVHIIVHKGIRAGMCPTCNHCLMWGDLECDECYQKITWF